MSDGTPNRQIFLRMVLGGFREHREHRAAAERMADDGVDRLVRAQHRREAVAKTGQVREPPGRLAMRRRIDADDRKTRRAQRCDEAAETCGVRAPAVEQHDGRSGPRSQRQIVNSSAPARSVEFRGLRDDGCVFGIHAAARRRAEHAQREPRGERRTHELHGAKNRRRRRCSRGETPGTTRPRTGLRRSSIIIDGRHVGRE